MAQLILEPTSQAQWQALVNEAQNACDRSLDETLESYLVFLLMRFVDKPECTARIMAEEYLQSHQLQGTNRAEHLRDVGDHCLLFSGLFPRQAERRLVRISYFVNIGRSSYRQLSDIAGRRWSTVYGHLSDGFIVLMDVLHAMRELGGQSLLTPIQAMELWQETGSRRCYQQLHTAHAAIPISGTNETH
jgi:hypothetical protein